MIVLHDPDTLLHDTVELLGAKTRSALESPERIKAIIATVSESKHEVQFIQNPLVGETSAHVLLDLIQQTHEADYLHHLENAFNQWREAALIEEGESILPECFVFPNKARTVARSPRDIYARAGYYAFDMSSGIMNKTYISTIASANLAYEGVQRLRNEKLSDIFVLCRPPGHHCDGRRAGGYCYVNNAAVAISAWRASAAESRVAILDVDFHHGNGTQEIYYSDPDVYYASIHGEGEFPYYTGMAEETGIGNAIGTNLNLPLKTGSSFGTYLAKLDIALAALDDFKPEFLLVSLGFDTFHLDPLGNFRIETEDYETMARTIRAKLADMPAIILLEGGYVLEHLGNNVLSFLRGWEATTQ